MARPREFEIDDAVQKAMMVFWSKGYQETTLPDLLKGMQITRGSFYKAFEAKNALFLKTLILYDKITVAPAVKLLSDTAMPDGWDRITTLFNSIVTDVRNGDRRGCLLCTTAAGPASEDPKIAKAVADGLDKMRVGFEIALKTSRKHSNLSMGTHNQIAHLLTTQYVGLRVQARANTHVDTLTQSIQALRIYI